MILLKRWLPVTMIFLSSVFWLGEVLAMGDLGPEKVPFKLLKNWESEISKRSERNFLIVRGFNVESARWVSHVTIEVQGNNVIVEVLSSPLYPWTKVNTDSFRKRASGKPISFEKEVVLPTPLLPEYSIYYRDINKVIHLVSKVRMSESGNGIPNHQ